ncbi:MarR family transcriptional regulator [Gorillibacterium sp. CAU 1737]|uniref:MarR family winged helix-turn-helix transcriptional regulator n=1 Tax=Gorillibacterium sp. CAU 1737 TaxID=3140362 RepID=UPI00326017D8
MKAELLPDIINRYTAASFTITRRVTALMRDNMPEGITQDQFAILQSIKGRPDRSTTSTELASVFCVGKSSITAIVARLEAKALLRRQEDPKDRRVTRLILTEEGERIVTETTQIIEGILATFLAEFDDEEGQRFIEPFEKLARLMKEADEGRES